MRVGVCVRQEMETLTHHTTFNRPPYNLSCSSVGPGVEERHRRENENNIIFRVHRADSSWYYCLSSDAGT